MPFNTYVLHLGTINSNQRDHRQASKQARKHQEQQPRTATFLSLSVGRSSLLPRRLRLVPSPGFFYVDEGGLLGGGRMAQSVVEFQREL